MGLNRWHGAPIIVRRLLVHPGGGSAPPHGPVVNGKLRTIARASPECRLSVPVVAMSPVPVVTVPGISAAPTLLIALGPPIWISRAIVLAVGVGIELRASTGIGDHLLRRGCASDERADQQGRSAQSKGLLHLFLQVSMKLNGVSAIAFPARGVLQELVVGRRAYHGAGIGRIVRRNAAAACASSLVCALRPQPSSAIGSDCKPHHRQQFALAGGCALHHDLRDLDSIGRGLHGGGQGSDGLIENGSQQ